MDKKVIRKARALTGDRNFRFNFNDLYKDSNFKNGLKTIEKVHKDYTRPMQIMNCRFGMALELTNLVISINNLIKADQGDKTKKSIDVAGAASDTLACIFSITKNNMIDDTLKVTMKNITVTIGKKALVTGAAAAFGLIGSVVDMMIFSDEMDGAIGVHDYWAAKGHQIEIYGALAGSLASSMLLVNSIAGSALFAGPFISIVGVVGAVLVVSGLIFSEIMKLSPYEKFSSLCFLADTGGKSPKGIFWSNAWLPVKKNDYIAETKVLLQLLANFKLEITKNTLSLYPGLYYENSVFYIELEFSIYNLPVMNKINGVDTLTGGDYQTKFAKLRFKFNDNSLKQTNINDQNVYRLFTSPDVYNIDGQKITDIKNRIAQIDLDLNQVGEASGGYDEKSKAFNLNDVKFVSYDNEEVMGITANVYLELETKEEDVYIPKKIKEKDTNKTFIQAILIEWDRKKEKESEFSLNKEKIIKLGL